MEEIAEIVREGMNELLPVIKMEAIVATALVALIFLGAFGIIIYALAKQHRKGGRE